jgi:D-glycero-beta-D-manno-heptose-7-phosphate kinase
MAIFARSEKLVYSLNRFKNMNSIFEAFNKLKVLIIGDVMIDSYVWGKVERISPEAPVPVVSVSKKEMRPGGGANVAVNIQSLGATPLLCSVIGNDACGDDFIKVIKKAGMISSGIMKSKSRITTLKTRVIGNNHQLIRIDEEVSEELTEKDTADFIKVVSGTMQKYQPDVIVFEDYDKGVLNHDVIKKITAEANRKKIPIAVDPKKKNFIHYKNVDLFKPNLKELKEGLKIDLEEINNKTLKNSVKKFRNGQMIKMLMVTLSEEGIFFSSNGQDEIIPAHVRNISDVSGAGDTVISVAALCLALNLSPEIIAALSNLAGGLVCEKVGVVPVDKEQLLNEAAQLKLN